jgi:hypothetical protein
MERIDVFVSISMSGFHQFLQRIGWSANSLLCGKGHRNRFDGNLVRHSGVRRNSDFQH